MRTLLENGTLVVIGDKSKSKFAGFVGVVANWAWKGADRVYTIKIPLGNDQTTLVTIAVSMLRVVSYSEYAHLKDKQIDKNKIEQKTQNNEVKYYAFCVSELHGTQLDGPMTYDAAEKICIDNKTKHPNNEYTILCAVNRAKTTVDMEVI